MLKFKNFNLSYKKFNNCTQYSFIRELRLLETKNWKKKLLNWILFMIIYS